MIIDHLEVKGTVEVTGIMIIIMTKDLVNGVPRIVTVTVKKLIGWRKISFSGKINIRWR